MAKKGGKGLGAADQALITNWQAQIDARNAQQQQGAATTPQQSQQGDGPSTAYKSDGHGTPHPDSFLGPENRWFDMD